MPELPEVETIARGLRECLIGQRIDQVFQGALPLRFPVPDLSCFTGRTVSDIVRRGKYLIFKVSVTAETADSVKDLAFLVHLGMSGRLMLADGGPLEDVFAHEKACFTGGVFYFSEQSLKAAHVHAAFLLKSGQTLVYYDPRRFGCLDFCAYEDVFSHPFLQFLGCEPDDPMMTAEYLLEKCLTSNRSLKSWLLDQRIIAGLGNIYVCEALFKAGLSPVQMTRDFASCSCALRELETLRLSIQEVLSEAIAYGGSTLRDYVSAFSQKGSFQNRFCVYDREGDLCSRAHCKTEIIKIRQMGRSTFYCPSCQKNRS